MTKKRETKADKVYKELAATGKYVNTGKVLIGVQYVPRNTNLMSQDAERLQSALLGQRVPMLRYDVTVYILYGLAVTCLLWAAAKAVA